MRSTIWLALLTLAPVAVMASDDNCKFRADRAGGIEAKGVEKVVIRAGAGDLKVVGRANTTRIDASGVACAGKQPLLDAAQINVHREGNVVYVETALPQNDAGGHGARMTTPASTSASPCRRICRSTPSIPAATQYSRISRPWPCRTAPATCGLERIAGAVDLTDSSGDLRIAQAGSVRLRDSSGDIEIDRVRTDVDVQVDSSGDMEISHVDGSVKVEQDSSGGIRVEDVKGSVQVNSDSSGDIYAARVGGDFTVSEDSSGSIGHEGIGGRISIPPNKQE
jgi:hypothetical protein